jgi:hypothetical protein
MLQGVAMFAGLCGIRLCLGGVGMPSKNLVRPPPRQFNSLPAADTAIVIDPALEKKAA